jgi:dephospho-CoA kinase
VYLIGLTGGIGAGKSTVAAALAEHGAVVIDADHVAREVVQPGKPALLAIIEAFGPSILLPNGELDRAALGNIIFGDDEARARLNSIVHPAVRERTMEYFRAAPQGSVVVYDVPLLIEAGNDYPYDLIVVAMASEEVRTHRLVELRGMTEAEARSRIESQATDAQRYDVADVIITTDGTMAETYEQVDNLWKTIALRAHD